MAAADAEGGVEAAAAAEAGTADAELPLAALPIEEPADFSRADARRRWATLIRLIYEVDPLTCPKCGRAMRVIALIQEPKVIDKILKHLRDKGRNARAGPWATGPPGSEAAAAAA